MTNQTGQPANILIIEDSPADQRAIERAFKRSKFRNHLYFVDDGEKAVDYLKRRGDFSNAATSPRPDLILLDLNLPRLDGRQVLEIIKADDDLRAIPVIVLTTSAAEEDVVKSYDLGVNSFITKPVEVESLFAMVQSLGNYWFQIVVLPPNGG